MKDSVEAFKVTFYPDTKEENVMGVQIALNDVLIKDFGVDFEEFCKKLELTAFTKMINTAVEIYVRELKNVELEEIDND